MSRYVAPGLPANWLNGWLAAVGATVLLKEARLGWSADPTPLAVFVYEGDLEADLVRCLPTEEETRSLAIAKSHPRAKRELSRKVGPEEFRERAAIARERKDGSLEATLTDLASDTEGGCYHGPFDPPAPRGITLAERVVAMRAAVGSPTPQLVRAVLEGTAPREPGNGLGFDIRRLPAGEQTDWKPFVVPLVELLCFFGIGLLPVRGDGRASSATGNPRSGRQRGWSASPSRRGAFAWPVWSHALDRWAIDGLLDAFWARRAEGLVRARSVADAWTPRARRELRHLGITGCYGSVSYRSKSRSDPTTGYGAERLW